MGIEEKYKIRYIDGRRYYEFDMTNPLPCLENTTPYLFSYRDILVCAGSWNRMTLGILSELDRRNPKSDEELLSIRYKWSKCVVFSRTRRTNYSPFRDLYLDTNHTSSHSMMNIQCLLEAYGVDLKECFFLYHCHPVAQTFYVAHDSVLCTVGQGFEGWQFVLFHVVGVEYESTHVFSDVRII